MYKCETCGASVPGACRCMPKPARLARRLTYDGLATLLDELADRVGGAPAWDASALFARNEVEDALRDAAVILATSAPTLRWHDVEMPDVPA